MTATSFITLFLWCLFHGILDFNLSSWSLSLDVDLELICPLCLVPKLKLRITLLLTSFLWTIHSKLFPLCEPLNMDTAQVALCTRQLPCLCWNPSHQGALLHQEIDSAFLLIESCLFCVCLRCRCDDTAGHIVTFSEELANLWTGGPSGLGGRGGVDTVDGRKEGKICILYQPVLSPLGAFQLAAFLSCWKPLPACCFDFGSTSSLGICV